MGNVQKTKEFEGHYKGNTVSTLWEGASHWGLFSAGTFCFCMVVLREIEVTDPSAQSARLVKEMCVVAR